MVGILVFGLGIVISIGLLAGAEPRRSGTPSSPTALLGAATGIFDRLLTVGLPAIGGLAVAMGLLLYRSVPRVAPPAAG